MERGIVDERVLKQKMKRLEMSKGKNGKSGGGPHKYYKSH